MQQKYRWTEAMIIPSPAGAAVWSSNTTTAWMYPEQKDVRKVLTVYGNVLGELEQATDS